MTPLNRIVLFSLSAACAGLVSCASVKKAGASSMAMVKDTTKATSDKIASVMPGPKVPVVEVREESLEEMPSGRERALAYERERRNSFWFFGPIDFQEPEMPEPGAELDGSLLPPRM